MKKSQYNAAADLVNRYYCRELREMAEKILETEANRTRVFGHDVGDADEIGDIIESYSQKLWHASASIGYLRQAASQTQPACVARVECSHDNVEHVLSNWLAENAGASILNISILERGDELICIITYQSGC